jgi:multiple sugar transport system permease protein
MATLVQNPRSARGGNPIELRRPPAKRGQKALVLIALTIGALFAGLPVLWMLSSSFKANPEIFASPPTLITEGFSFDAYTTILTDPVKLRFFGNSYLVALSVTLLTLLVAVLAAYAFSRYEFRGKKVINVVIVSVQAVPPITLLIPYFGLVVALRLYNTYPGLILTYMVFTLPCLVSVGIYTFMIAWNEFLFALTLTRTEDMRTVPIGIQLLMGQHSYEWNEMMAMSILGCIPVLLLFLFFQRYFIGGMTAGAVKV